MERADNRAHGRYHSGNKNKALGVIVELDNPCENHIFNSALSVSEALWNRLRLVVGRGSFAVLEAELYALLLADRGRGVAAAVLLGELVIVIHAACVDVTKSRRIVELGGIAPDHKLVRRIVDIHAHFVFLGNRVDCFRCVISALDTFYNLRRALADLVLLDDCIAGFKEHRLENPKENQHNRRKEDKVYRELIPQRQEPPSAKLSSFQSDNLPLGALQYICCSRRATFSKA